MIEQRAKPPLQRTGRPVITPARFLRAVVVLAVVVSVGLYIAGLESRIGKLQTRTAVQGLVISRQGETIEALQRDLAQTTTKAQVIALLGAINRRADQLAERIVELEKLATGTMTGEPEGATNP